MRLRRRVFKLWPDDVPVTRAQIAAREAALEKALQTSAVGDGDGAAACVPLGYGGRRYIERFGDGRNAGRAGLFQGIG